MSKQKQILILGIGNVLWADEGFGVRVVESLQENFDFPENVQLIDGGTQGLYLLQHVQTADILIVLDAVNYGLPAGSLKIVRDQDVPSYLGAKKMSLHQTGFQEVLATAELLDDYPEQILLIGVQPEELEDYGGSLRSSVREKIAPAIKLVLDFLKQLGVAVECKEIKQDAGNSLSLTRYEQERPSEKAALRLGDPRVLLSNAYEISPRPSLEDAVSVDVDHRGKY